MKKSARILAVLAAAATLGLGLSSCDYWDTEWYKEGGDSGNSAASSGGGSTDPTPTTSSWNGKVYSCCRDSVTEFCQYGAKTLRPSATAPNKEPVPWIGVSYTNSPRILVWLDGDVLYYYWEGYTDCGRKIPIDRLVIVTSGSNGEEEVGRYREVTIFKHRRNMGFIDEGFESIDMSYFDTSNVTDMRGMFPPATKTITGLDTMDTSNVTDMSAMFNGCTGLTSLDLSGLGTSSVTDMSYMFHDCTSLTSLDLSGLDTSSVTDMSCMFHHCTSLTSVNMSGLDTSSVTYNGTGAMFDGCSSLTTIYASPSFVQGDSSAQFSMFSGCTSLVGGAGTTYAALEAAHASNYSNVSPDSRSLARIDGGPSDPGYFTLKP